MYFYTVTHHQAQKFCNRVRTRKTIWLSILFHNSCPLLVCSPSYPLICNFPCSFLYKLLCVHGFTCVHILLAWLCPWGRHLFLSEIVWLWLILYILSPPIFLKIFWVDLVFQFFFQDRVSLCNCTGCPGIHSSPGWPRTACICRPSTGIKGVRHHTQINFLNICNKYPLLIHLLMVFRLIPGPC